MLTIIYKITRQTLLILLEIKQFLTKSYLWIENLLLKTFIIKITAIDDYIAEQSYSIVGLVQMSDWDERDFPLSESEFKSSVEDIIANSSNYYDPSQIDAADFEDTFSDDVSLELDFYFSTVFEDSIFNNTMEHSDIEDIAERLIQYIF